MLVQDRVNNSVLSDFLDSANNNSIVIIIIAIITILYFFVLHSVIFSFPGN